jgi:uncharacterized protein DUF4159
MRLLSSAVARASGLARVSAVAALALALVTSGGTAAPQRRGGGRAMPVGLPWIYDGAYVFCRLAFKQSFDGDGGGWAVDYPKADLNFPFRLGQLTTTPISRDTRGEPNHVVVTPDDPHLFECPFVMMTEPGGAYFDDVDAARLRAYLDKGGFLWADDFWGEYAWQVWEREIRKVLPASQFPLVDVPVGHMIRNIDFIIKDIPQIPSIDFWFGSGFRTSERADSTVPHMRAILDERRHIIVLITHNTDFGDAFEREGENRAFFDQFAARGYAVGINIFLYAMTH